MKQVDLFILALIMEEVDVSEILTDEEMLLFTKELATLDSMDEATERHFSESLIGKVRDLLEGIKKESE